MIDTLPVASRHGAQFFIDYARNRDACNPRGCIGELTMRAICLTQAEHYLAYEPVDDDNDYEDDDYNTPVDGCHCSECLDLRS